MDVYIAIKQADLTFTCFNSIKALAQYLSIDSRTVKKHINSDKLFNKEFLIRSTELIKFTRKHKKGFNVSITDKKAHNYAEFS